jgi:hypothetical protein
MLVSKVKVDFYVSTDYAQARKKATFLFIEAEEQTAFTTAFGFNNSGQLNIGLLPDFSSVFLLCSEAVLFVALNTRRKRYDVYRKTGETGVEEVTIFPHSFFLTIVFLL